MTTLEQLRTATAKLNLQEIELEKFFQLSNDILCIATVDGKILKSNQTFSKVTGYSQEELKNMGEFEVVCDEDIETAQNFCSSDEYNRSIIAIRHKDGTSINVEWTKSKPDDRGYIYVIGRIL